MSVTTPTTETPWRNPDTLASLYSRMTAEEVAEELGCCKKTVLNWTKKYGFFKQNYDKNDIYFDVDDSGYERITDGNKMVRHHQLLACLDNDPKDVFSNGKSQTHHTTCIPWDNRANRLQQLSREEHSQIHAEEEWEDIDGERQLVSP